MQAPKLPSFLKHQGIVNLISRRDTTMLKKEDLDNRVKSAESGKTNLRFSKDWQQTKRSKKTAPQINALILIVIILVLLSFALLKI